MTKKSSKAEARYQDHPKMTQRCQGCSMFRSPDSCTAVVGKIARHGWCKYWEKKS